MEAFKIWCETNEIRDKVLEKMEKEGIRWISFTGRNVMLPTQFNDVYDSPMGLFVEEWDELELTQSVQKDIFDRANIKEISPSDYLKESEPSIDQESYNKGFKDCYEIVKDVIRMSYDERKEIFGGYNIIEVTDIYTFKDFKTAYLDYKEEKETLNTKICIVSRDENVSLTVGKIYEIKKGFFESDNGEVFPHNGKPAKDIDDLKRYFGGPGRGFDHFPVTFVEIVE